VLSMTSTAAAPRALPGGAGWPRCAAGCSSSSSLGWSGARLAALCRHAAAAALREAVAAAAHAGGGGSGGGGDGAPLQPTLRVTAAHVAAAIAASEVLPGAGGGGGAPSYKERTWFLLAASPGPRIAKHSGGHISTVWSCGGWPRREAVLLL
jgi:hypothetical protein